jgi:hypothetical protein
MRTNRLVGCFLGGISEGSAVSFDGVNEHRLEAYAPFRSVSYRRPLFGFFLLRTEN